MLIDSGADASFMDWGLAKRLELKTELLEKTIKAKDLNGNDLFTVTHATEPVRNSPSGPSGMHEIFFD